MIINIDKFLIQELNKHGYDIDYKKFVEIYKASREIPAYKAKKARNTRSNESLEAYRKPDGNCIFLDDVLEDGTMDVIDATKLPLELQKGDSYFAWNDEVKNYVLMIKSKKSPSD